ncbi:hypothetical protein RKT31_00510 [Streptococcus pneumoniae]|nr:hypothetical protein [Streptococcus pneumoniae]MDS5941233.1 hypothetical protein [Streptococcus pneumoniae]MDS5956630.1 hypothetical protein [Streptococcus pneumoniae]MDS8324563.1 hypothetical protein [Streptococcus pneumoniae]MDT6222507.1 hypothetical protein [Streptococcus pneumoniae]
MRKFDGLKVKSIRNSKGLSLDELASQDTPIKKNRHSTPVNPKIYKEFIDNVNQYQRLTGATYEKISNIIGKSNSYIYDVIDKQRKSTLSIKSDASLTKGSMILRQEIEKIESGKNRIPSKLTYQTIDRDSEVVFRFNGLIKSVNDLSDKELQIIVSIFDALKIPAKISKIEIRETNVFGGGK